MTPIIEQMGRCRPKIFLHASSIGSSKGKRQVDHPMDCKPTYTMGENVTSNALFYEHLKWKPHERITSIVEHENPSKVSAFNPNHHGHTIKECMQLKARIYHQIDIGNIPHTWDYNTIFTYHQPEPIKHTRFIFHYFTLFRKSLLQIYNDLVQNGV